MKRIEVKSIEPDRVSAYLPQNYRITEVLENRLIVEGEDVAGWTADGYVIPRLASGLIFAQVVESGNG